MSGRRLLLLLLSVTVVLSSAGLTAASPVNNRPACEKNGTFCLQLNNDNSFAFNVRDSSQTNGRMSIVIQRIWRQGKFFQHKWIITFDRKIREADVNVSFFPSGDSEAKIPIHLTVNKHSQDVFHDSMTKWSGGKYQKMSNQEFFEYFPVSDVPQKHRSSFNSSDKFDELMGLESRELLIRVSFWAKYQSSDEPIIITKQTSEPMFLFVKTGASPASGLTTELPAKGGTNVALITVCSLIVIVLLAIGVVSLVLYRYRHSQSSGDDRRT